MFEIRKSRGQPLWPGHPDVVNHRHAHAHPVERLASFFRYRKVTGPSRYHRDKRFRISPALVGECEERFAADSKCSRDFVVSSVRKRRQQTGRLLLIDPRREHRFTMFDERGRDLANLLDGFTGAEDHFRITTAAAAVEIDCGSQLGGEDDPARCGDLLIEIRWRNLACDESPSKRDQL